MDSTPRKVSPGSANRLMVSLQKFIVKNVYADHNKSHNVKREIANLIAEYSGKTILNLGSGDTRLHPSVINLDICDGPLVDIIGSADNVPMDSFSVDLVISQEMLEHVASPSRVMNEIYRILRPDGALYLQVPWIIGYHGCPNDYWRFSRDGIRAIAEENGFTVLRLEETVGPFAGFYRISVEAFAILGSIFVPKAYKPFKIFAVFLFAPLKFLDLLARRSKQSHRLAGGFFVVAKKTFQK
jgi:SAM-dependent methyltransferase